jgi:hypothetical protein
MHEQSHKHGTAANANTTHCVLYSGVVYCKISLVEVVEEVVEVAEVLVDSKADSKLDLREELIYEL